MFIIGIDPHKRSHTAAVLDDQERTVGELRLDAGRGQRDALLTFASKYTPRWWAVEGASGLGSLLAQQLVAVGETVIDVPPTLSARARLLDSGSSDKTDAHDARSAAIVAMRHRGLHQVRPADHAAVLRLLADRRHDLVAARITTICRLHALLAQLVPGGANTGLSVTKATVVLAGIDPIDPIDSERKTMAGELAVDISRLDSQIKTITARITTAIEASNTTVTDIYGIGPAMAAVIIGHSGHIDRFPTAGHYARYNGTAPIEASSGPKVRHRLNPRGNRQLNHALHVAAIGQIRRETTGRAYYDRKIKEGKTRNEAIRALKRRISDSVYRHLVNDAR